MDPQEHVVKFSCKNRNKIDSICEPLESLGITCVVYLTLSESGYFSLVSSKAEVSEFFYANQLYHGHPLFRTPKYLDSGTLFPGNDPGFSKSQEPVTDKHSLGDIMCIGEKIGGVYHLYAYAGDVNSPSLKHVYQTHQKELIQFIPYFNSELQNVIHQSQLNKVNIAHFIGNAFL